MGIALPPMGMAYGEDDVMEDKRKKATLQDVQDLDDYIGAQRKRHELLAKLSALYTPPLYKRIWWWIKNKIFRIKPKIIWGECQCSYCQFLREKEKTK